MPSDPEPLISLGRRPLYASGNDDRYFDYCLQPYAPRTSPAGKLRGENLLWASADLAGAPATLEEVVRSIQRSAGRDLTVFGVKHEAGRLWWELYFYDADRGQGAVRSTSLPSLAGPRLPFTVTPRESLPYFMFSFDLHPDLRPVDAINYYLPYYGVQGGRSYKLTASSFEFENVYRFYDPKREAHEMLHDLKTSALVDYARVPLQRALLPELYPCNRICIAKKRRADAVYYSGIDVDQLLFFLRRFGWPEPLAAFVAVKKSRLDHLRFDVGIDFAMDSTGGLVTTKSSYYGTL